MQAPRDCPILPGQKAAARAVRAGSRLSTASARSSRAGQGSVPADVQHTQKAYARGDVHEQRAEGRCALRKPSVRVLRGVRTYTLPG